MEKINKLEYLIDCGILKSYSICVRDDDGNIISNPGSGNRESDELELVFASGDVLIIGTFCSGTDQNTTLFFN